jgi:NitT/TauT family transport system substrate-binding protein
MLTQTRRRFLTGLSLAGASLVRAPKLLADERRLETTTVRLAKKIPVLCNAPQYIADDLLRAEGFTDIQYGISALLGHRYPTSWTKHERARQSGL